MSSLARSDEDNLDLASIPTLARCVVYREDDPLSIDTSEIETVVSPNETTGKAALSLLFASWLDDQSVDPMDDFICE